MVRLASRLDCNRRPLSSLAQLVIKTWALGGPGGTWMGERDPRLSAVSRLQTSVKSWTLLPWHWTWLVYTVIRNSQRENELCLSASVWITWEIKNKSDKKSNNIAVILITICFQQVEEDLCYTKRKEFNACKLPTRWVRGRQIYTSILEIFSVPFKK